MNRKYPSLPLLFVGFLIAMAFVGCDTTSKTPANSNSASGQMDLSSWKTHRNDPYHFQLKYPSSFVVEEKPSGDAEIAMISVAKNGKEAWVSIFPEGSHGGRISEEPIKSGLTISGKGAVSEQWNLDNGGVRFSYRFVDPITDWKLCDESVYCEHIDAFAPDKANADIVRNILSSFEFID